MSKSSRRPNRRNRTRRREVTSAAEVFEMCDVCGIRLVGNDVSMLKLLYGREAEFVVGHPWCIDQVQAHLQAEHGAEVTARQAGTWRDLREWLDGPA